MATFKFTGSVEGIMAHIVANYEGKILSPSPKWREMHSPRLNLLAIQVELKTLEHDKEYNTYQLKSRLPSLTALPDVLLASKQFKIFDEGEELDPDVAEAFATLVVNTVRSKKDDETLV